MNADIEKLHDMAKSKEYEVDLYTNLKKSNYVNLTQKVVWFITSNNFSLNEEEDGGITVVQTTMNGTRNTHVIRKKVN